MADHPRIEELRRRVQKDPASIAFAQLAEEFRRAGQYAEAIDACHAGLAMHPGYLSARVTLGRALIEVGELDQALLELTQVLNAAPENLAALRGLAEIHHRRGDLPQALEYYRSALEFARNDPDLEQVVEEICAQIDPARNQPAVADGLSFDEAQREFLSASTGVFELPVLPPPAVPELARRPNVPTTVEPPSESPGPERAPASSAVETLSAPSASPSSIPVAADLAVARAQFAEFERWLDALGARAGSDGTAA